jgi:hypothetical protein
MLRYVRYAAALVFALLAVGFVALWVRSYWWSDKLGGSLGSCYMVLMTNQGIVSFDWSCEMLSMPELHFESFPFDPRQTDWRDETFAGFGHSRLGTFRGLYFPLWFLAATSLGLAALFAFKRAWRYSLRAILVATTLLAAILGLAVYAV